MSAKENTAHEITKLPPNDPATLTVHHRKPRSLHGGRSKRNISHVPLSKHRAWHILYDDHTALEIMVLFAQDYEVFGTDIVKSDLLRSLHENLTLTMNYSSA